MSNPVGRPLLFATPEELQQEIEAYFSDCDPHLEQYTHYEYSKKTTKNKKGEDIEVDDYEQEPTPKLYWHVTTQKPYTITGLANFLKTSRETLINYQEREDFFDTVKAAKDKCEHFWELQLLGSNATGPIFNLKNNYDWKDKTEQDITSKGESTAPADPVLAAQFAEFLKNK